MITAPWLRFSFHVHQFWAPLRCGQADAVFALGEAHLHLHAECLRAPVSLHFRRSYRNHICGVKRRGREHHTHADRGENQSGIYVFLSVGAFASSSVVPSGRMHSSPAHAPYVQHMHTTKHDSFMTREGATIPGLSFHCLRIPPPSQRCPFLV